LCNKADARIPSTNILRVGLASAALPGATQLNLGCTPDKDNGARNTEELPEDQSKVSDDDPNLGGARTARLAGGGMLGIRDAVAAHRETGRAALPARRGHQSFGRRGG
jgi:hypothetical protein